MNIDSDKIKELVTVFSSLDEEYQHKFMKEAYKFKLLQSQKNQILKEGIVYKTEKEFEEEIEKRATKRAKESLELLKDMKRMNDTDKATLFMLINQMATKKNTVQESDISITINNREVTMKEYLENHLGNADYDKAHNKVKEILKEQD